MTLGTRIEQLRHERGLGQNELAVRAGIASGHLSHIEHGRRSLHVSVWTVQRLAAALGVGLDELMRGVDVPESVRQSPAEPLPRA